VSGCCSQYGCDELFGERFARRTGRRYRRKGLDGEQRRIADFLGDADSVLEIGGGVGAIALELGKHGAAATLVEVVPAYEPVARELAEESGVQLEFRLADLVADPDAVDAAGAVALNKVVCCTPDGVRLTEVAARLARRRLALSYPRETRTARLFVRVQNVVFALVRRRFRVQLHRHRDLVAAAEGAGLRLTYGHEGRIWRVAGFERP
jgi:magnesium-protoporphyrin O-methyltransferase